MMGRWTEEEKQYLIEYYNKKSKDDIANHLNRTKRAIEGKAQELKICKKTKIRDQFVIGAKFGKLTIIEKPTGSSGSNLKVKCQCECKNIKEVYGYSLIRKDNRKVTHCGCSCVTGKQHGNHKHGTNGAVWKRIKKDCVEEWKDSVTFYKWYNENKIEGKHLTKENEDLPYGPTNYKFRTQKEIDRNIEQARETSRKNWGKDHYAKTKEFKTRIKKTNRIRYDNDYPMQNPKISNKSRQKKVENGHIYDFDGMGSRDIVKNQGVSQSTAIEWIKHFGEDAFYLTKKSTAIEQIMEKFIEELGLPYQHCPYIENMYPDFIVDDRLSIECDGLYFHNDIFKDKYYHRDKQRKMEALGYTALFFREDEIHSKFDIIKSIIRNKLGLNKNRVYARKCKLIEKAAPIFFSVNHLMGKGKGKVIGLEYEGEIVCALQHVRKKGITEISRFCCKNNYSVVGGFSRLVSKLEKPVSTFIDRRYGDGSYLLDLGFELVNNDVSFKWVKNDKSFHRMQFPGNSGYEHGYRKIWDCGQAKYILK